jgi:hypothetical protein
MQIAPGELRKMSLWEFSAMIKGWNAAHETGKPALTETEQDELFDFINEPVPGMVN